MVSAIAICGAHKRNVAPCMHVLYLCTTRSISNSRGHVRNLIPRLSACVSNALRVQLDAVRQQVTELCLSLNDAEFKVVLVRDIETPVILRRAVLYTSSATY